MSFSQAHQTPRRLSLIIGVLAVVVIVVAGMVYALTQLTVTNNVTINSAPAIGVATFTSNPTTCPVVGNSAYSIVSPVSNTVAWVITAGGSQTQYFCIENQGTANDPTPSITLGTVPTTITCTTTPCLSLTTSPTTIPALAAQSVSSPVGVTLSATPSTTGSGTVDITVS